MRKIPRTKSQEPNGKSAWNLVLDIWFLREDSTYPADGSGSWSEQAGQDNDQGIFQHPAKYQWGDDTIENSPQDSSEGEPQIKLRQARRRRAIARQHTVTNRRGRKTRQ